MVDIQRVHEQTTQKEPDPSGLEIVCIYDNCVKWSAAVEMVPFGV